MALDPYFTQLATGSTAACQAATSGVFFGDYTGLSDLGNDEVVFIQTALSAGELRIFVNDADATSDAGVRIYSGASLFDHPAMRAHEASQMGYVREGGGSDTSAIWTVWRLVRG